MPSLIELVFSAVGADQVAAATQQVQAEFSRLAGTMSGAVQSGIVSNISATQQQVEQLRKLEEQLRVAGLAAKSSHPSIAAFGASLRNLGDTIGDSLTPRLDAGMRQLLAFGAAALSLRAVYNGFKNSIADGAALEQLSLRTGESVRNLVIEEQAFRNAGLGASYLATASNLLDRALSPLNQNAKRNAEVFHQLGLSMASLRAMSFYEQITALSAAFAKLPDQASRTEGAMQLFGRYAGGQMLQLFSDPNALPLAEQQAGSLADAMARDAAAFNDFRKQVNGAEAGLRTFWAGATEQVIPMLEGLGKLVGKTGIDLHALGMVAGPAGLTALGGLGAIWGSTKLDTMLLNAAEKFRGSLLGAISGAAEQGASALATWLPMGLAAVIAEQIVFGVLQAYEDAQVQAILSQNRAVIADVADYRKGAAAATNDAEWQANKAAAVKNFATMSVEREALEARRPKDGRDLSATSPALRPILSFLINGPASVHTGGTKPLSSADYDRLAELNKAIPKAEADIRNIFDSGAAEAKAIAANAAKALHDSLQPLVATLPQLEKKHHELALAAMSPQQRLGALQSDRAGLERQLATLPAGLTGDEKKAKTLDLENQIAELKKQEAETQAKIAAQTKEAVAQEQRRALYALETQMEIAKAAGDDRRAQQLKEEIEQKRAAVTLSGQDLNLARQRIAAEHQIWEQEQARAAAKQRIEAERQALQDQLAAMRANLAALQGDYTQTKAEKWTQEKAGLERELAVLQAQLASDQAAAARARKAGGPGSEIIANQFDQAARDDAKPISGTQQKIAALGPAPDSFGENFIANLTRLKDSLGTAAQQLAHSVTSVLGGACDSLSQHLASAIDGTERWRLALGRVAVSIERSLVQAMVNMGVKWAESLALDEARTIVAEARKTAASEAGAHARTVVAATETAQKTAQTTTQVAVHAAGESAQTGTTASSALARTAIRIHETVAHALQVTYRVMAHAAGEVAQTAVTIVQSGLRIARIVVESLAYVIKAAVEAFSAMASIPYIGPILGAVAMAGVLAAGIAVVRGIGHKSGGWTSGGSDDQVAGVVHANEWVAPAWMARDPRYAPMLGQLEAARQGKPVTPYSLTVPAVPGNGVTSAMLAAARAPASPAASAAGLGSAASGPRAQPPPNVHIYLDKSAYLAALQSDLAGIAHEVYDRRARRGA